MNLKKTLTILSVGALAVASVVGVVAYRTANAQATTPSAANAQVSTPNAPTGQVAPPMNGPADKGPGFGRGPAGGYNNEDLANALGITVDELNTAYQKANQAALDQAVKAGLITQAQADEMSAGGGAFPFGGHGGGWLGQNGIDFDALLADALGISVDKLQAAYAQAFNARIDQAVTDGNLTQDQGDLMKGEYALRSNKNFQSAMQSAYEAAVNQAVSEGVITQAQADLILQNKNGMGFGGFGGPPGGGFGGPGRHGGWGSGAPAAPAAPATSTTTP